MPGFLDNLPDLGLGGVPRRHKPKPTVSPDRDVVTWVKVYCPQCGSGECPVIDSRQIPLRKHKCKCGHEFWSNEKNYRPHEEDSHHRDTESTENP